MNKRASIYIDVRLAERYGYMRKVRVHLNGREVKRVVSAKSGKNGFVEYAEESSFKTYKKALKLNDWPSKRVRGNVVIKFNMGGGL